MYAADIVQLKMMRLYSTSSRQNITYNCKNSNSIMRLKLDNNKIIDVQESTLNLKIIMDECQVCN